MRSGLSYLLFFSLAAVASLRRALALFILDFGARHVMSILSVNPLILMLTDVSDKRVSVSLRRPKMEDLTDNRTTSCARDRYSY